MDNGKKIVFFGTSEICIPFLNELNKYFEIELIITQPDRRGKRRNQIIQPPVKLFAIDNNIKFIQPETLNSTEIMNLLRDISPDIGVVISYGNLIPERIYKIPDKRIINVHFSLLPKYRGAAPVQRAIENGETKTGITIFQINKSLDAGKIWRQIEVDIKENEKSDELLKRLSEIGKHILIDTINKILKNQIFSYKQKGEITYAPPISKQEGRIDFNQNAFEIYNKFRAFYPWPGIYFFSNNKMIKIKDMKPLKSDCKNPGMIIELDKNKLTICTGNNTSINIKKIQPENKKEMTPLQFSLGNKFQNPLT